MAPRLQLKPTTTNDRAQSKGHLARQQSEYITEGGTMPNRSPLSRKVIHFILY